MKSIGGIKAIQKINTEKSKTLYGEIDSNRLFKGTVETAEDRSDMNVCFVMNDASLEESFLQFTKEQGIVGIKGHRLVGGFRASLYNALPISSVQVLKQAMHEFALQYA